MEIGQDLQFAHDVFEEVRYPKRIIAGFKGKHFDVNMLVRWTLTGNTIKAPQACYALIQYLKIPTYTQDISIYIEYASVLHHNVGRKRHSLGS